MIYGNHKAPASNIRSRFARMSTTMRFARCSA